MSEFHARKTSSISVDPEAKSKKLDETIEKLSTIRAERKDLSGDIKLPSISAKNPEGASQDTSRNTAANSENEFVIRKGSSLRTLRVTSVVADEPKKMKSPEEISKGIATSSKKAPAKEPVKMPEVKAMKQEVKPEPTSELKQEIKQKPELLPSADIRATKRPAHVVSEMFEGDADNEPVLMLSPNNSMPRKRSIKYKLVNFMGFALSAGWLGLSAFYIQSNMGFMELFSQQPHILGGFLAGILAPVALLWMILAYIQRGSDIQMYADALRSELQAMIFPSEERSEVIHKDIEALVSQAAELSASSKTVLNSIHRARVGLRNEIRDFSGISKKTEFHIDRLADSLAERSTKLLELTNEIEERTTSLDAKTLSGAKAWDEAATSILSRAADIETAMQKGAAQIVSAANEAEETTGSINTKLSDSFEVLKSSVDSVKAMTGSTVRAITEASKTIEDNRDSLGEGAKLLSEKASEITDTLNGSVSAIQNSVDEMVTKTDGLEDRLNNRVVSLNNVLSDMDGKINSIETTGVETANKLSEAMVSAVSGADNIGSAVRRAIESLGKATGEAKAQADLIVNETSEKISGLHETGESTAHNIQNILKMVDSSREKMEESSQMVDAQVEKLSAAVEMQSKEIAQAQDNLDDRVEAIQLHMNAPLEAMSRAVDNASEKHAQIEETLSKRVVELNSASDKALENASTIRDGLRSQTQEISTLVGQLAGHSRSVHSLMNDQKEDLSESVGEVLNKIETVSLALETQSDKLTNIAQSAEQNISQLKGSISTQCDDVAGDTNKVIGELKNLDVVMEDKIQSLVKNSVEASRRVEDVTSALVSSAEMIEPVYSKATNQIDLTRERFEKMSSGFEEGTISNLDKLKSMGIMFDERLQTLTSSAEDASRILDHSSENLSNRVEDIDSATKAASDRLQDMERLFKNQASEIHLTTDQALLKIENIQKALNDQFQDISASVGESVAQIEDVGQNFVKQATMIKGVSESAIGHYDKVGAKAEEQTQQLKQLAKMTAEQMEQMVRRVQAESKQLLESSSQTLIGLKKAGDGFSLRAKSVEEQMRLSLKTTHAYGDALDQQADKVAETSHRTADKISEAIAGLSGKMLDVNKAASDVSVKIELSRDKLSAETDHLADVAIKASRVVEEASSSYVRQSNSLFKATQDAVNHAEKIRQADGRVQRESFMSSTKFVLESLHSLSVDLTRMIDGNVQEKVWKAYQKGDISAFTSRLLDQRDKLPFDKMREKYKSDNEFRTYVNRFARQFEEVYEQAAENDHGEILAATFSSSDVGRLYEMLCDIAGRQNLIQKNERRAA